MKVAISLCDHFECFIMCVPIHLFGLFSKFVSDHTASNIASWYALIEHSLPNSTCNVYAFITQTKWSCPIYSYIHANLSNMHPAFVHFIIHCYKSKLSRTSTSCAPVFSATLLIDYCVINDSTSLCVHMQCAVILVSVFTDLFHYLNCNVH